MVLAQLSKIIWSYIRECIYMLSILLHWPVSFWLLELHSKFWNQEVWDLQILFFFKMILATWGPLIFYVNVRMNFSISVKKKKKGTGKIQPFKVCNSVLTSIFTDLCNSHTDSRTLSSFPKEARTYQQSLHLALSNHQYTFCLDLPIPDIFL